MELSLQQKRALLAPVRCFLLDMDGTFYLGNQLLEGSLDFLSALDATGRTACFLTNNSSKSARVYDEKLARMGVPERYRRVITSGHAAAHYCLKTFPGKSAWVLGNDMLKEELCAMGLRISEEAPDYVLIAYDTTLLDSIGNDPIKISDSGYWIAHGFLNFEFVYAGGYPVVSVKHMINLLQHTDHNDGLLFEFRHNAFKDRREQLYSGVVSFPISSLLDDLPKPVKIKVKYHDTNTSDRTIEFNYQ